MNESIVIQSLNGVKLEKVRQTLVSAFSEYAVPMNPSISDFRSRMQRNAFSPKLSAGVFQRDDLVGFILSGINDFQQKRTAYNAGTGVIKEFRGQGLTSKMYDFLLPQFKEQKVQQGLLEVITGNAPAIKAYQNIGFNISRELLCLKLDAKLPESQADIPLKISKVTVPDWELYTEMLAYEPSWQFTTQSINRALSDEIILEATSQTKLVGFISFTPHLSRISQIGVSENYRGKKVGRQLIRAAQALSKKGTLTVLNIDKEYKALIKFLESNGFKHFLSQYEMILPVANL